MKAWTGPSMRAALEERDGGEYTCVYCGRALLKGRYPPRVICGRVQCLRAYNADYKRDQRAAEEQITIRCNTCGRAEQHPKADFAARLAFVGEHNGEHNSSGKFTIKGRA